MIDTKEQVLPQVKSTIGEAIGAGYGSIHADGIETQEAAEELVRQVEEYLRRVAEGAPGRCIDGRCCDICMDGTETEPRPAVAGGPLVSAYAAAELTGWFAEDAGDSDARMSAVHRQLKAGGIVSGAHCDETASMDNFEDKDGNGKTGCGANDRLPEILKTLHDNGAAINAYIEALLGRNNDREDTDKRIGFEQESTKFVDAATLEERHAGWQPRTMINEIGADETEGQHCIEILASKPGHQELAVAFNDIDGTTIDNDALFRETGKQVFVVDVWYLRKLAKAMVMGPDKQQESRLLHAMVAYQIATYLTLCDGSQRPIRVQEDLAPAA